LQRRHPRLSVHSGPSRRGAPGRLRFPRPSRHRAPARRGRGARGRARTGLPPGEEGVPALTGGAPPNASKGGNQMMHFPKLAAAAFAAATLTIGAASAQTVLRAADTHPDGYPTVEAVKYFGERLKERTDGRYPVEVFHSSQFGEEADTVEQVRAGVIDINRTSLGPWNNLIPESTIPSLPYIFRSVEHARKVMNGPVC